MNIAGKIALVTGAGGALGRAMVQTLLDADASKIYALDIAPTEFHDGRVTTIECDVSDSDTLEKALSGLEAVDILVNNAGILHSAPLVNITNKDTNRFAQAANDWRKVIDVNLSSVFYVTSLVADRMVRDRKQGVIVNISSVSAGGNAGQSAYSASKAGVNALTSVWAKELGPLGIRSVAIAPGYIDTASTHKAVSAAQLAAIKDKIAMKALGKPESILQALTFAIENDYANGTVIEVDGGLVV